MNIYLEPIPETAVINTTVSGIGLKCVVFLVILFWNHFFLIEIIYIIHKVKLYIKSRFKCSLPLEKQTKHTKKKKKKKKKKKSSNK